MNPLDFFCLKQKVKLISMPKSSDTPVQRAKVSLFIERGEVVVVSMVVVRFSSTVGHLFFLVVIGIDGDNG